MFTIKAINYDEGMKKERVVSADYYEVISSEETEVFTVMGYTNSGSITCHHEVFEKKENEDGSLRCDVVFITNVEGKTVDRVVANRPLPKVLPTKRANMEP